PALEPTQSTGQLEEWLTGQEQAEAGADASLVSGAATLEPLRVFRVWRALWFMLCSGAVLLAGLGLYLFPPSSRGWLAFLVVFLGSLAAVGWFWPAVLPAVFYGAAPGVVFLGGMLLLQWLLHERYRRQLVFMPGFTRVKAGSS